MLQSNVAGREKKKIALRPRRLIEERRVSGASRQMDKKPVDGLSAHAPKRTSADLPDGKSAELRRLLQKNSIQTEVAEEKRILRTHLSNHKKQNSLLHHSVASHMGGEKSAGAPKRKSKEMTSVVEKLFEQLQQKQSNYL